MARRATGSDLTQPDRDYGRVHAHGPDLQDPSRRPLRFERRNPQSPENREALAAIGAPKMAGRSAWERSTARRPTRARRCSSAICAGCHNAWPYTWTEPNKYGKRFVRVGLVPQTYVGTDPGQFQDLRPYAITGQLSGYLPPPYKGKDMIPTGVFSTALWRSGTRTGRWRKLKLSEAQTVDLHGYREFPLPPTPVGVYKAAPRDGVWATPPFLHNGSVPNLYEMLIPAKERTKKFYIGREFDPVKVGLDTSGKSGTFLWTHRCPEIRTPATPSRMALAGMASSARC